MSGEKPITDLKKLAESRGRKCLSKEVADKKDEMAMQSLGKGSLKHLKRKLVPLQHMHYTKK